MKGGDFMVSSIDGLNSIVNGLNSAASTDKRQDMFKKMDANGDGVVTKEEMQTAMDQISLTTGKSIDVDKLFAELDTDGNGQISQAEWDAHEAKMAAHRHPSPEKMFTLADTDKDGYISKDELKTAMENLPARPDGKSVNIDDLFTKMDTDGDGKISKSEFADFHKKMATHMRPNEDTTSSSSSVNSSNPDSSSIKYLLKSLEDQDTQKQSLYQSTLTTNGSLLLSEKQSTVDLTY
jgi:Ca2+-binding EF-hand superfamily protein